MKMSEDAGTGTSRACTTLQVLAPQVLEGVVVDVDEAPPRALLRVQAQIEARGRGTLLADDTPDLDVIELLLRDKRNANTRRAYAGGLRDFFAFRAGFERPASAQDAATPAQVQEFLEQRPRDIALDLARYKAHLIERGCVEVTVNRYLAPVRALLKVAHRLELCATDGVGLVDSEKVEAYRDVRGLSLPEVRSLLALPQKLHGNSVKGLRDAALISLLFENGLRRGEVCKLDVKDFSLPGRRLSILGKGRGTQKEIIDVSKETAKLVGGYLLAAGHANGDGPLFRNLHRGAGIKGNRLTPDGLYKLTISYGNRLGIANARPHRLRHSTGTLLAQATGGDMTKVQKTLRHKDIRTSERYVEVSRGVQGEMTNLLSKLARGK